jgi:hypothetical protein
MHIISSILFLTLENPFSSFTTYFVQYHNQFLNQTGYKKNCSIPYFLAIQMHLCYISSQCELPMIVNKNNNFLVFFGGT